MITTEILQVCFDRNENFLDETIAAAETAYRENLETRVGEFAKGNKGSILGDLVNMVSKVSPFSGELLLSNCLGRGPKI